MALYPRCMRYDFYSETVNSFPVCKTRAFVLCAYLFSRADRSRGCTIGHQVTRIVRITVTGNLFFAVQGACELTIGLSLYRHYKRK